MSGVDARTLASSVRTRRACNRDSPWREPRLACREPRPAVSSLRTRRVGNGDSLRRQPRLAVSRTATRRVGNREDQRYLLPALLRQGRSFELSRPQLRLQVAQASLNLYQQNPGEAVEDHIRSSPIWRRSNRDLQPHPPRPMGSRSDQLGEFELP